MLVGSGHLFEEFQGVTKRCNKEKNAFHLSGCRVFYRECSSVSISSCTHTCIFVTYQRNTRMQSICYYLRSKLKRNNPSFSIGILHNHLNLFIVIASTIYLTNMKNIKTVYLSRLHWFNLVAGMLHCLLTYNCKMVVYRI